MKKAFFAILEGIAKPFRGTGLKKIPGVALLYNAAFSKLRPESATIDGFTMFLDPLDTLGLATPNNAYESFLRHVFKEAVKPGDIVLDLGAHIGYYTLLAARLVGPTGKVFAFEASPVNVPILEKNVAVNGFDKTTIVVPKAVSGSSGTATLYLFNRYGSGQNSLYEKGATNETREVETTSLDDYFGEHPIPQVNVMKIDIEGAEWYGWQGMQKLLAANPHMTIFTEFCPRLLAMAGIDPQHYIDAIEEAGFKLELVDHETEKIIPISAADLVKEFTAAKDNLANIRCTR